MEYKIEDLGAYKLHLIKTKKFKTVTVRLSFRRPIVKEEITKRNILGNMLIQSSHKYPSKRDIAIKTQDLYAADLSISNARLGNYTNTYIFLSVLNDKYTEKGNLREAVKFLNDILFDPDVIDNKFKSDKLDIVKASAKTTLNSIKEDTSSYSVIRMLENYDSNSPVSYRMLGYLEDLDNINEENLYEYYLDVIKKDIVDIYIIGDIDFDEIKDLVKNTFKLEKRSDFDLNCILDEKNARSNNLVVKEEIDNSQTKLSIALNISNLTDYERKYPLTLFNIIYGGGTDSKLFQVVREKNSLCYYIFSVANKLDNILILRSGIDKNNYDKTIKLIEELLEEMKDGKFDESNINIAKEYFNTALEEIEESEARIIDNYYMMDLIGTDTIDVKREKMNKVTKEEILAVAKKVSIDTIFSLEGVKNEEN